MLQHATFSHPTSSLPQISQWATKSEDVGLIARGISFQDFQPIWYDPPTLQTDGQTDDMRQQDRALHCSALRGNYV